MRAEPIAEDFDALSLPHNLCVPPDGVCRFQCHAPKGLSIDGVRSLSCAIARKR